MVVVGAEGVAAAAEGGAADVAAGVDEVLAAKLVFVQEEDGSEVGDCTAVDEHQVYCWRRRMAKGGGLDGPGGTYDEHCDPPDGDAAREMLECDWMPLVMDQHAARSVRGLSACHAQAACVAIRECWEELVLSAELLRKVVASVVGRAPSVAQVRRHGTDETHHVSVWAVGVSAEEMAAIEQTPSGAAEGEAPGVRRLGDWVADSPYGGALLEAVRSTVERRHAAERSGGGATQGVQACSGVAAALAASATSEQGAQDVSSSSPSAEVTREAASVPSAEAVIYAASVRRSALAARGAPATVITAAEAAAVGMAAMARCAGATPPSPRSALPESAGGSVLLAHDSARVRQLQATPNSSVMVQPLRGRAMPLEGYGVFSGGRASGGAPVAPELAVVTEESAGVDEAEERLGQKVGVSVDVVDSDATAGGQAPVHGHAGSELNLRQGQRPVGGGGESVEPTLRAYFKGFVASGEAAEARRGTWRWAAQTLAFHLTRWSQRRRQYAQLVRAFEVCAVGLQAEQEQPVAWIERLRAAAESGDSGVALRLIVDMPEHLREQLQEDDWRYASLMAGAGGRSLAYGCDDSRWEGVAVEVNKACAAVHEHNDEGTPVFVHRMTLANPLPAGLDPTIKRWAGEERYVHVSAGPPCQPFSMAGCGLGAADPRDGFPAVLEAVRRLRPLIVEIENVQQLVRHGTVVESIVEALRKEGYWVRMYSLDASHYGVPQARQRLFFVGSRLGPLEAPAPSSKDRPPTVGDVIGAGSRFDAFRTHHPELELTESQRDKAQMLDMLSGSARFRELQSERPARTLTAANLANNTGNMIRLRLEDGHTLRRLSVMEAAALQSFPPWASFPADIISQRQAYKAIGNALPTELGRHLTEAARRHVEEARALFKRVSVLAAQAGQRHRQTTRAEATRVAKVVKSVVRTAQQKEAARKSHARKLDRLAARAKACSERRALETCEEWSSDCSSECSERSAMSNVPREEADMQRASGSSESHRLLPARDEPAVELADEVQQSKREEASGVLQEGDGQRAPSHKLDTRHGKPTQESGSDADKAPLRRVLAPVAARGAAVKLQALDTSSSLRSMPWAPAPEERQGWAYALFEVELEQGVVAVESDARRLFSAHAWRGRWQKALDPQREGSCGGDARQLLRLIQRRMGHSGTEIAVTAAGEWSFEGAPAERDLAARREQEGARRFAVVVAVHILADQQELYDGAWFRSDATQQIQGALEAQDAMQKAQGAAEAQEAERHLSTCEAPRRRVPGKCRMSAAQAMEGTAFGGLDQRRQEATLMLTELEAELEAYQLERLKEQLRIMQEAMRTDASAADREASQRSAGGGGGNGERSVARSSPPACAALLLVLVALFMGNTCMAEFGGCDTVTAMMARFEHRLRLQRDRDTRWQWAQRQPVMQVAVSAVPPREGVLRAPEQASFSAGVAAAEEEQSRGRRPLRAVGLGIRLSGTRVSRFRGALYDSGAAVNAMDVATARRAEKEGRARVQWQSDVRELSAFEGSTVSCLGSCTLPVCVQDRWTGVWSEFEATFMIVDTRKPIIILGNAFLAQHCRAHGIAYGEDGDATVSLVHPAGVVHARADCGCERTSVLLAQAAAIVLPQLEQEACESLAGQVSTIAANAEATKKEKASLESHPIVMTVEDCTLGPHQGGIVKVQIPRVFAGQPVVFHPLPRAERQQHVATRLGIEVTEQVHEPDAEGYVGLYVENQSSKSAFLPAHHITAQYRVKPDMVPWAELDVDAVVNALHVPGRSEEEMEAMRVKVKEQLMKEREERRAYFSMKRVGRAAGIPEAHLELTPEFIASGKAPPSVAPRPVTGERREAMLEYWRNNVDQGQLISSTSPYGSVPVVVRKPGGRGFRLALDFRAVNDILVKQHYDLKSVRSCMDALSKSKYYSTLDMIAAFWQIPLSKASRQFTAVNFDFGKYEFTTMPMGLQAASAIFQKCADALLVGLQPDICVSYIDDVIIHGGDTVEEHLLRVARVIDRIGGAGFTFRPDKCFVGFESIEFLGARIGHGTIRPDDSKTSQIREAEFPRTTEELSKWIGLVQYCSQHVPNCAFKLGPLHERMSRKDRGPPTAEELHCFNEIKTVLTDPLGPVLKLPDFDRPFYLLCDAASTKGAGVVLAQIDEDGHEHPVAFWSRRWREEESRWHSLEHECATVFEAVKRFSMYLTNKFYIITDAEPLVQLRSIKKPKGKLATWSMELQTYDYEVIHRPGRLHKGADIMSRLAHVLPAARGSGHRPIQQAIEEAREREASRSAGQAEQEGAAVRQVLEEVNACAMAAEALARGDGVQAIEVSAVAAARDGVAGGGTRMPAGPGAAYSQGAFRRGRIAALTFSTRKLMVVRDSDGRLYLPAAHKRNVREPVRDVARRALEPCLVRSAAALGIVGASGYCLSTGSTKHLIIPSSDSIEAMQLREGAEWLDLVDASVNVALLPWAHAGDARSARRVQLLVQSWATGEPHTPHLALAAACEHALVQRLRGPVKAASAEQRGVQPQLDEGAAASAPGVNAVFARRPTRAMEHAWEALNTEVQEATTQGVLEDGRVIPTAPLTTYPEVAAALRMIQDHVTRAVWEHRAKEDAERCVRAAMAVDFEFSTVGPRELLWMQVAIGDHIMVFDLKAVPSVLRKCDFVSDVRSLAFWLESKEVLKVVQACASDVALLSERGIVPCPVFDTAIADCILRGDMQQRGLGVLLDEYIRPGLMMVKSSMTSAMHAVVWRMRPMPPFALVYAWQDVAYCVELAMRQRALLLKQGRLDILYEFSRSVAERDASRAPGIEEESTLVLHDAEHVLLLSAEPSVRCSVAQVAGRVKVHFAVGPTARHTLPRARFAAAGVPSHRPGREHTAAVTQAMLDAVRDETGATSAWVHKALAGLGPRKRRWVQGRSFMEIPARQPMVAGELWGPAVEPAQSRLRAVRLEEAAGLLADPTERRALMRVRFAVAPLGPSDSFAATMAATREAQEERRVAAALAAQAVDTEHAHQSASAAEATRVAIMAMLATRRAIRQRMVPRASGEQSVDQAVRTIQQRARAWQRRAQSGRARRLAALLGDAHAERSAAGWLVVATGAGGVLAPHVLANVAAVCCAVGAAAGERAASEQPLLQRLQRLQEVASDTYAEAHVSMGPQRPDVVRLLELPSDAAVEVEARSYMEWLDWFEKVLRVLDEHGYDSVALPAWRAGGARYRGLVDAFMRRNAACVVVLCGEYPAAKAEAIAPVALSAELTRACSAPEEGAQCMGRTGLVFSNLDKLAVAPDELRQGRAVAERIAAGQHVSEQEKALAQLYQTCAPAFAAVMGTRLTPAWLQPQGATAEREEAGSSGPLWETKVTPSTVRGLHRKMLSAQHGNRTKAERYAELGPILAAALGVEWAQSKKESTAPRVVTHVLRDEVMESGSEDAEEGPGAGVGGGVVDAGTVAMIQPETRRGRAEAKDIVHRGLRVYHDAAAPPGLQRGLALSYRERSSQEALPILRAVCTGRVRARRSNVSAHQSKYLLDMGGTGYVLYAHPLTNAWALANEGAVANCIFQMLDLELSLETGTVVEPSVRRQAATQALRRIRHDENKVRITVALLVQVAPVGEDGRLTVHYGSLYTREGYVEGSRVQAPGRVSEREVFELLEQQQGLSRAEAIRALMRCGAPLDAASKAHTMRVSEEVPAPPRVTKNTGSQKGAASIPALIDTDLDLNNDEASEIAAVQARREVGGQQGGGALRAVVEVPTGEQRRTAAARFEPLLSITATSGESVRVGLRVTEGAQKHRGAVEGSLPGSPGARGEEVRSARVGQMQTRWTQANVDAASSIAQVGAVGRGAALRSGGGSDAQAVAAADMFPKGAVGERETPAGGVANAKACKFVHVVVHDGNRAVFLQTKQLVSMGALSNARAIVAGRVDEKLEAFGIYAAWHAVRTRLGAVWEWPELGISKDDFRLVGASAHKGVLTTAWYEVRTRRPLAELRVALESCFAERSPTETDRTTYERICIEEPRAVTSSKEMGAVVRGIVEGTKVLMPAVERRLAVPHVLDRGFMAREDVAYQADLEDSGDSYSFQDVQVAVMHELPVPLPRDVQQPAEPSHRATRARVARAVREQADATDDDEADDGDDGAGSSSSGDDGAEAHFVPPNLYPHTHDPAAFIKYLQPAGMPADILRQLIEDQKEDPFCKRVASLYLDTRGAARVLCRLSSQGGGVRLTCAVARPRDTPQQRRWRRRIDRARAEFHRSADGALYYRDEDRAGRPQLSIVVPESQRQVVMRAAHDGMLHMGRERTIDALRSARLWWPGLPKDVKDFVKKCPTCAFNNVGPHHGAMHIPPDGWRPWQVVTVDIVYLCETASGNCEAIVFADRFGRGVRAFPVPKTVDAKMFLNVVTFGLIPSTGVTPSIMISDRGSNLIAALCQEYYETFGIEGRAADANMHTAVALTERFNHTLRRMARAAYFDSRSEWDLYLPYLVLFYNATIQKSTGYSPYFIEHGREPFLPWHVAEVQPDEKSTVDEYIKKHLVGLHLAHECLKDSLEQKEAQRKAAHDRTYQTTVRFAVNDRVLLLQPGRVSKMEMPYIGPYRIVSGPDERDRYVLRDLNGRRFNEFHVGKLKFWPLGDNIEDGYYEVDHIRDSRAARGGQREYLVRWKGYSKKYDSWQTYDDLNDAAKRDASRFDRQKAAEARSGEAEDDGDDANRAEEDASPRRATQRGGRKNGGRTQRKGRPPKAKDGAAAGASAPQPAPAEEAAKASEDRDARAARRAQARETRQRH